MKTYPRYHIPTIVILFLVTGVSNLSFGQAPTKKETISTADVIEGTLALTHKRVVKTYGAKVGRTPGYASGIIISQDGRILTANGTYLNGERVRVIFPSGDAYQATVEKRSRELQLAVLKVDLETPDYFDLTQNVDPSKGDWILSISNAFKIADGAEPLSVGLGIVSLRTKLEARRGTQRFPYEGDVFLIDSITSNPGAPGGAVVNSDGNLVGIIGPNLESGSTGTRINYAIPIDVVQQFLSDKPIQSAKVTTEHAKAYVGIRLFKLGGSDGPAYVDRVSSRSPAAKSGFRPDDLILAIGEERIKSIKQYEEVIDTLVPDTEIIVTIKRKNSLIEIPLTPTAKSK